MCPGRWTVSFQGIKVIPWMECFKVLYSVFLSFCFVFCLALAKSPSGFLLSLLLSCQKLGLGRIWMERENWASGCSCQLYVLHSLRKGSDIPLLFLAPSSLQGSGALLLQSLSSSQSSLGENAPSPCYSLILSLCQLHSGKLYLLKCKYLLGKLSFFVFNSFIIN